MSEFREIPLPEENPLNIIVEDVSPVASKRGRKKKVEDTPAPEGAEA